MSELPGWPGSPLVWLLQARIIHGSRDPFPFLLIQLPLVLGVWMLAWRRLLRQSRAPDVILWCGVAFFLFLFTSRFAAAA